ncbi:ATP-binding protein [Corallococcus sp. CA054B]|uniref:AAA family ATPase n=1 Tax=Corallococcus sp. CA054B TaxID=2316734 RepID=UPI000EA2F1DD|nr:AAA family ATPase [Corallococcus sp. CA054B]RKG58468.1 ATP-binding protein [Corallococcus sp. CA054B]
MKLTVHKLGRITDAELDIRPLTVFSGHNGTNKTWLAWALFELLWTVSTGLNTMDFLAFSQTDPLTSRVRDRLKSLFEASSQGTSKAAVTLGVDELGVWPEGTFENMMDQEQLSSLFGEKTGIASDARVELSFSIREMDARHDSVVVELEPELGRLSVTSLWTFTNGFRKTLKRTFTNPQWDEDKLTHASTWPLRQLLLNVLCFPADRAGLLLAAEGGDDDLDLPHPVTDFLSIMRLMRGASRRESPLKDALLPFLGSITGGNIRFTGDRGEERLVLEIGAGQELPISVASSLSRSLAGLTHYIRSLASPGDVLLIDELEMNAHPVAQLALVELMAVMVNHGIRIIFTTHSPYIIDHLNNLLEAGRAPEAHQAKLADEFRLKTREAFLPADKVAVYAFEATSDDAEVKVTNAISPETGLITKSTFAPVTQRLSQIFNAALDATEGGE